MRNKIINVTILLLFAFGLYVRLYKINEIPIHLGNDEISIAYDAYSIGLTLRDEHNELLPLSFQSHGTYKAPLYVYLTVFPTKLFGNSAFSARIVSAIAGLLTILMVFLIVSRLTNNKLIGLFSALILTFAPVHIISSRMALESNLALFFLLLGIYWLIVDRSKKINTKFLLLSALSFSFSIYAYHTEWLLTPFLTVSFVVLSLRKNWSKQNFYKYGLFLITIILLSIPIFIDFLNNLGTNARSNTEMLWHEPFLKNYLLNPNNAVYLKIGLFSKDYLGNFSNYVNLGYIFFDGLPLLPQFTPYLLGLLLPISLPFLLIGFICGPKYIDRKFVFFTYIWLVSTPLLVSLTRGGLSFYRYLPAIVPYVLFIGIGMMKVWQNTHKKLFIWGGILLLHTLFFGYFFVFYFKHFPKYSGEGWQYGYQQIAEFISPHYVDYDYIVIDPRFGENNRYAGVPRLYIPYYTNLSPRALLKQRDDKGVYFDKYGIYNINWYYEPNKDYISSILYVVPESNLPPENISLNLKLLKIIYLPNEKSAFRIYELLLPKD